MYLFYFDLLFWLCVAPLYTGTYCLPMHKKRINFD